MLQDLDWLVVRCSYDSRGEGLRTALAELVRRERSKEIGQQIADGYRRIPQTAEEVGVPDFSSWNALDDDWAEWA